jgi:hypothetical protein
MHLLDLRDEFELRRRRLLNEIDELMNNELHGRVSWRRRNEIVDSIECLFERADATALRNISWGIQDKATQNSPAGFLEARVHAARPWAAPLSRST